MSLFDAWYNSKSQFLFSYFPKSLFLSFPFSSPIDISPQINSLSSSFPSTPFLSPESLSKNLYTGPSYSWNGHAIPSNSKPLRLLRKILPAQEYLPIESKLSHLLSLKSLSGNLILSILPKDYLSLSLSTTGWTTCLNFYSGIMRSYCLRYLNDPHIFIAYLQSPKTYKKKWRCAFYLNAQEKTLSPLAQYPFQSEELLSFIFSKFPSFSRSQELPWNFSSLSPSICLNCASTFSPLFPEEIYCDHCAKRSRNKCALCGALVSYNEPLIDNLPICPECLDTKCWFDYLTKTFHNPNIPYSLVTTPLFSFNFSPLDIVPKWNQYFTFPYYPSTHYNLELSAFQKGVI